MKKLNTKLLSVLLVLLVAAAMLPLSVYAGQECYQCHGTGNCTLCDGAKTLPCDACTNGKETCDECHGSGKDGDDACWKCGGSGQNACRACKGTIKCNCNRCNGDGKCLECYGTGWRGERNDDNHPDNPSDNPPEITGHTHEYGAWSNHDETMHARKCECGDIQYENHLWDSVTVMTEATHQTEGSAKYTCTPCGYTKTERVSAIDHTFTDWTLVNGEFVREWSVQV